MHVDTETKTERIDLRTTSSTKRLLQEAASAKRKSVTEFVLDAALEEAGDVLAERRLFILDDEQWSAFMAALDAPTTPRPRLKALLSEPSVFE